MEEQESGLEAAQVAQSPLRVRRGLGLTPENTPSDRGGEGEGEGAEERLIVTDRRTGSGLLLP